MDPSSVPVISLAGVTCLSDVLSELPLPTPYPELVGGPTQTLYFHHRVAEEAQKYVQCTDSNLVATVSSLLSSANVDHVILKDEYCTAGKSSDPISVEEIMSGNSTASPLLKMVLQTNPETFNRRRANAPGKRHQSELKETVSAAPAPTLSDRNASANTSGFIKSDGNDQDDEIPEHMKHLFRHAPVVRIEPMDVSRAQSSTAVDNKASESMKKRIVSIGKQPKAFAQGAGSSSSALSKKKRTMVSELFDSLTPAAEYFAEGSRRRRTIPKNYNEYEKALNAEEAVSELCGEDSASCDSPAYSQVTEQGEFPDAAASALQDQPHHQKRHKKSSKSQQGRGDEYEDPSYETQADVERPLTPTEVIKEREKQWQEIMKKRREKRRRRTERAGGIYQMIDPDELVENEAFRKFCAAIDTVFDNAEDVDISAETVDDEDEIPAECLIPKHLMVELCSEGNKLKILGAMNRVPVDRLTKLITMLQKNVKDGANLLLLLDEKLDADESVMWREATNDRVLRSADAALVVMTIMTSASMPKPVFIEDAIDRCVAFVKFQLQNVIFAAYDPLYRVGKEKPTAECDSGADVSGSTKPSKRSRGSSAAVKNKTLLNLYGKISELIGCFADLVEAQTLTDTTVLQLSSLGVTPFFVENIGELQLHALRLVANIFGHYPRHRKLILEDILASLARLPSTKRGMRTYRLNADEYIQMVSALVMQLVQSVVRVPSARSSGEDEDGGNDANTALLDSDVMINTSYDTAIRMSHMFLSAYLKKCTTKSEEDYRPLFEAFVEDLLTAVHKPDWPAAELLLSLLGRLLVQYFSNKQIEMSLRVASLDYLGVVASRLRKDAVASNMDEAGLQQILHTLIGENDGYDGDFVMTSTGQFDSKRIKIKIGHRRRDQHAGAEDRIEILQRALMDYLAEQKESDSTIEFAKNFYIAQWYRDCASELTNEKPKTADENEPFDDDEDVGGKQDKKAVLEHDHLSAAAQQVAAKKQFLLSLAERDTSSEFGSKLRRSGNLLPEQEAAFVVRYLASKRPLSQSFDIYLAQILRVLNETAVAVRTKALKCLSAVVEADPSVLGRSDIQQAVHARLLDQSSSVREAAIDLIGKFICAQPDFVDKYYKMIMDRILDTGVSVRKRVIKILKDICDRRPDFDRIPEICVRILRRANDEESVKKLVVETFHGLWFVPVRERDTATLLKKVMTIIDVIGEYGQDAGSQYDGFEAVLSSLWNKDAACEKGAFTAAGQIVNCLVENVLTMEEKLMDSSSRPASHSRLLACLTTLYLFSKVRPPLLVPYAETMQPYLLMNCGTKNEQAVLVQVVKILEMVVPLLEHPNPQFLSEIENNLIGLAMRYGPQIIQASISCLSAVVNGLTKNFQLIQHHFFNLFDKLLKQKNEIESKSSGAVLPKEKPALLRTLFTLGLFCRYFDMDQTYPEDKKPESSWNEQVFRAFLFFTSNRDEEVKLKALGALGAFCINHAEFMIRAELKQLYCALLLPKVHQGSSNDREVLDERLKCQVLRNVESFLKEEEAKLMKSNEQWDNSKKSEDLKELCESASGLGSSVIQHYLREVEECYFHSRTSVRGAACDVVVLTLQQGLVHPAQCIPHVIAMQTDQDPSIRAKADKTLKEVETKYPSFIQMKAGEGLKLSFRLQMILCQSDTKAMQQKLDAKHGKARGGQVPVQVIGSGARGLRLDESGGPQALNSQLYSLIRTGRMQRRAFLKGLLQLFDENSQITFEEMIYVVDNLASFPYQIIEEPLFICHYVDIVVSVTGASLVQSFLEGLLPKVKPVGQVAVNQSQYGLPGMQPGVFGEMVVPGGGVMPSENRTDEDDDDEQTVDELIARLPPDFTHLEACISSAQGCLMLLSLKRYLKDVYVITDSKLQEYSPAESAKAYDKAINRRPTSAPFQPKYFVIGGDGGLDHRLQLCQQYFEFKQMLMSIDTVNVGDASDEDSNQQYMDQQMAQSSDSGIAPTKKRSSKGASRTGCHITFC